MAAQTRTRELVAQAFFDLLDADNELLAKVRSIGGGDITFEVGTNREGGAIFAQKMATIADVGEVTLSRAILPSDSQFYDWLLDQADVLGNMPEGTGAADPDNLKDLTIVVKRRDGTEILYWTMHGCSITGYTMPSFDNMSGDLLLEEVRIQYEWPELEFVVA